MPSGSSTPSGSSNATQTKAIAGGVTGATGIIILGLIIFCILRRKRRYKAIRSASSHEVSTSCDVLDQRMPQSTRFSPTPQPFFGSPMIEISSPSKGTIPHRTRALLAQSNRGDIEEAINPFNDPVPAEGSQSNNDDEGQQVRDTIDRLQALTNRFEGQLQQLGALAQSGPLSTEDRLKLEEIRHTTGLMMPCGSRPDRFSMARSSSSDLSSSPPSYHTHDK
jgi:hypothetical protein